VVLEPVVHGGGRRRDAGGREALDDHVVAGPSVGDVVPRPSDEDVVAVPAEQRVGAVAADQHVVAGAAVEREERRVGGDAGRLHHVGAGECGDDQPVAAGDRAGHGDPRREAADLEGRPGTGDDHAVVAVRRIGDDRVGRGVVAAADRGEFAHDLGDIGPAQVADHEVVDTAEGVRDDRLDVVEVHRDRGHVAEEAHAPAVGGGVHVLVGVASVEDHLVRAVLTLDDIAAVARVPLERVGSRAEEGDVVALLAVREVVAVSADQQVHSVASEQRVVARAAVDRDPDQGGQVPGRGGAVVAAVRVEHEPLGRADVDRERRGIEAVEPHARPVRGGGELLGAAAAVDLDGVLGAATLVEVGVVTGVPDHAVGAALPEGLIVGVATGQRVVLDAAEQEVGATLSEQRVVAGLAGDLVGARAAGERVVARTAHQPGRRQCATGLVERDDVVACHAEDLYPRRVGNRRRAAQHRDRPVVDQDLSCRIAADLERVVSGVADHPQDAGAEGRCRCRVGGGARRAEHAGGDRGPGQQPARRATVAVGVASLHRLSFWGGPDVGQGIRGTTFQTPCTPRNSRAGRPRPISRCPTGCRSRSARCRPAGDGERPRSSPRAAPARRPARRR
jgi:hypothetical protein